MQKRSIAITGIGIFSPIGIGREAFWDNLKAGKSGIEPTKHYHCTATPGCIGGEVKEFTEEAAKKDYLKSQRKSIKVMSRETQLGTAAALQALADSKLDLEKIDHQRMGVLYGANLMFFPPDTMTDPAEACKDESGKFQFDAWGSKGIGKMEPLWMLRYLPNMPACHIAIFTDARGPNNSVTLDEASPGVALTEALNIMERGAADMMLVGGTGTRIHPVRAIHARLADPLGFDEQNPSASCKPFDTQRNGQVASEAAVCLVLEEAEHAKQRGATIYGYLLGGGSSCVAKPTGEADIAKAVLNASKGALRRAGLEASDLGHVNAHGVATVEGDRDEAAGLRQLLDGSDVPVTALKGYFGNAGAASGFMEIVGSLLSMNAGAIPPILNCDHPDTETGLHLVHGQAEPTKKKVFLNINYTKPGQASAVVIAGA
ncbi:beta-ketoacyl-[acyl-carrier-protein] synthase family protein [Planctomicrobium piriforme]|uniref:beta-ketoacyl-[acyl-carrier-protein] synthase family protein n=1 Tax=Planctomicrobium piriforme TaxID=1576369 RepID=UPI001587C7E4|nr:beta-ketoacyl-[acyl-carrier-protein] synthase family protein [Planctomicrobium piriforme]